MDVESGESESEDSDEEEEEEEEDEEEEEEGDEEEAQAMLPSAQKQDEVGYVTECSETRRGRLCYLVLRNKTR